MSTRELEQRILEHVEHPNYRPVKPRVIAAQLGVLDRDELDRVRKAIKRLAQAGQLVYGDRHVVHSRRALAPKSFGSPRPGDPPGSEQHGGEQHGGEQPGGEQPGGGRRRRERGSEERGAGELPADVVLVTGTFRRAAGGFGFVRPLNAGPQDEDIYIASRASSDAAHGDRVQVRLGRKVRRGPRVRISGEVIRVLERASQQFVGTYLELWGRGLVRVDGNAFAHPVFVGDPGAKGVRPGDKVVLEMVRYPRGPEDEGEAVITEVLGERGSPGFDSRLIASQFSLPGPFEPDVLESAREQARLFDGSIPDDRTDLTELCTITIDPVDARDFDDAVSVELLEGGHWRLGVHIADVAHFVPFRSPLDREARERGTSIYLPDRVIPMLPELVSNNLASLQPDKVRYTKTAFMEFSADGILVATDLMSSAIRSQRRFTYEEVDEYLAEAESWRERLTPAVHELLGRMAQLARILHARRMARGALELDLPEVKLELNAKQEIERCRKVEHTESHRIIEEFMLAANEAVAQRLSDWGIHFLRRVHMNPDPRKMLALTEFVRGLGIQTESLESRFELRQVLQQVRGKPEEYAVNFAALRSLAKAEYAPAEEGHYALASDCYCHFTSPIRRYPDLTIHRTLDFVFRGKRPVIDLDQLMELGRHCSQREQRAEQAEREMIKLKLLNHLSSRIGQRMEGVVTGVEDYGLFVQGLEFPAEGLVHISSLNEDRYFYDSRSHTLNGHRAGNQFRLGDRVRVVIAKVDLDRRQLDLQVVGHTPGDRQVTSDGGTGPTGGGSGGSGGAGGSGRYGRYSGGKAKHRRGGGGGPRGGSSRRGRRRG